MARGSLLELETQLEIAAELGMGSTCELSKLQEHCYKTLGLLNRLLSAIKTKAQV
jgi:four helix bundle protein